MKRIILKNGTKIKVTQETANTVSNLMLNREERSKPISIENNNNCIFAVWISDVSAIY